MIVAINYANEIFKKAQRFNTATAINKGKVDKVISYSPKDIDKKFRDKNKNILNRKRGNGYWLWKPYFILHTLNSIAVDDYLVYLDSGAFYLKDVRYLVNQMKKDNQEIMAFELPFKEYLYTKRDAFVCMQCDEKKYIESNQRMATMIIFKKCENTFSFVKEWLFFGQIEDIITDAPNHLGKENYKGFRDHRHDQSIFSLLSKKYNIPAYRDPSQFGRFPDLFWNHFLRNCTVMNTYMPSDYPQIIAEHRKSNVTKKEFREQMVYACAPKKIVELFLNNPWYSSDPKKREKIAFLTDNMPIKDSTYGFGMHKVVNRMLIALNSTVDIFICTDINYAEKKIDSRLANKIVVINKFHAVQNNIYKNICFSFQVLRVMFELRQKGIKKVLIPLGADYHELQRAYIIAHFFHMEVSIYVVDDFLEYQREIVKNELNYEKLNFHVARYLQEMKYIFVISEGMKKRILSVCGRKSTVIPLPFDYREIKYDKNERDKQQIIFLGGINSLYNEGLRDIAEVIDQINREKGLNIKLLFTYRTAKEVKHLIGNYDCIASRRIEDEDVLRQEIKNSLFCFMPYSDKESLFIMQNTSFPSKLIEYLASARSIVVYGNIVNSAQQYFEKNSLQYVVYGRDKAKLKGIILNHINEDIDYSKEYVEVLKRNHSFGKVSKKILHIMQ